MAKSKGTMQDVGMDMGDFYDVDLIKPTKKKETRKNTTTKKTSFIQHTIKDNRKNVT